MDAEERAQLEEEREFLLRSLADLDRELEAGDIDAVDHRTLTAGYTARAAHVLRQLDAADRPSASTAIADAEADADAGGAAGSRSGRSTVRRLLPAAGVVVFAVVAGLLVMQSSGERGSAGLTGLDVRAVSQRLDECVGLDADGRTERASDCYDEVLEAVPGDPAARASRGWFLVRNGDLEAGIEDLDAAVQVDPDAANPRIWRAVARTRAEDPVGAVADLAAFYGTDPGDEARQLADGFAPEVVEGALDRCISGDVEGSMDPVTVLQCYRDILEVEPRNATASVYLGWLLARSGLEEEALALLDDGLAGDPSLTAGYVFRAAVKAHLGDPAGALADLDAFDAADDPPQDQVAAAARVRAAVEAGEDPLPT